MSRDFFASMEPLPGFNQMIEPARYKSLPADWTVLLTDVKNSTKAIESGNYKAVNMIGASGIMAVQNALAGFEFPYIFGGDGATMAVPEEDAPAASRALSHTRSLAKKDFGLELRISVIKASEIFQSGAQLNVAKLKISASHHLAQLSGNGWGQAEAWMKSDRFLLPDDHDSLGDLAGLECRWSPIPARKEEILAIIVQARKTGERATEIYRELLHDILDQDLKPISVSELKLGWPPPFLGQEAKMRAQGTIPRMLYFAKSGAVSLAQALILKFRGKRNQTDPLPYLQELTQNTDYVKFDEALRVIVDVSKIQKSQILTKLEDYRRRGDIFYGHHSDRCALLTCYIQGPQKHIHFVDAAGGGYALAAKQLKAQKSSAKAN